MKPIDGVKLTLKAEDENCISCNQIGISQWKCERKLFLIVATEPCLKEDWESCPLNKRAGPF